MYKYDKIVIVEGRLQNIVQFLSSTWYTVGTIPNGIVPMNSNFSNFHGATFVDGTPIEVSVGTDGTIQVRPSFTTDANKMFLINFTFLCK